jgi:hypothetical protein
MANTAMRPRAPGAVTIHMSTDPRFKLARGAIGIALVYACVAAAQTPPEVPDASPAERLLFLQPHLANIEPPRTLRYGYVEEGADGALTSDAMSIDLRASTGGACCHVRGTFLSGPRALQLPEVAEARSNPALLYFLEHEVRRLQQQTKGQAAHFRQRIRLALARSATISATTVRWGERDVPAQVVRIAPFLDDPYRKRFEELANKQYAFVLSDDVPGGVYQVLTTLPGSALRETLTLQETPDAPSPAK